MGAVEMSCMLYLQKLSFYNPKKESYSKGRPNADMKIELQSQFEEQKRERSCKEKEGNCNV